MTAEGLRFKLYRDQGLPLDHVGIPSPVSLSILALNDLGDLQFTARDRWVVSGRSSGEQYPTGDAEFSMIERPAPISGAAVLGERLARDLIISFPPREPSRCAAKRCRCDHRLRFPARDHLPIAPIEFLPGARDVEIRIVAGTDLTANVLLPEDLPVGLFAVLCQKVPAAGRR
jgi:hypothetical protein